MGAGFDLFDATNSYGTPSYYVQQLFSRNRPDTTLPTRTTQPGVVKGDYRGKVGVGTWRTQAEFKDEKVIELNGCIQSFSPTRRS